MRSPRRSLAAALLLTALVGCGSAGGTTRLDAGQEAPGGDATSTTPAAPEGTSTTAPEPTTTTAPAVAPTEVPAATTTSTTALEGGASSPADGLTAAQLKAAVTAPLGRTRGSATSPTIDRLTLGDGTSVWRVRVPGRFAARAARVQISVGDRIVGEGVLAPDLGAITAVTTDGSGLTPGAPVSYRWEGGPLVAAGTLAVVR